MTGLPADVTTGMVGMAGMAVVGGVALVLVGLAGMLLRRSLLAIVLSGQVASLGAVLSLVGSGLWRGEARLVAAGIVLLIVSAAWGMVSAAVALAAFRRRGTVNVDELRELRG